MVNNIISKGTCFRGEIVLEGNLRIEGIFEGRIQNQGSVYISQFARVVSDICAKEIIVGGLILGNLFAEKSVKLLKTAVVHGNIYTGAISMDEGMVLEGVYEIIKVGEASL